MDGRWAAGAGRRGRPPRGPTEAGEAGSELGPESLVERDRDGGTARHVVDAGVPDVEPLAHEDHHLRDVSSRDPRPADVLAMKCPQAPADGTRVLESCRSRSSRKIWRSARRLVVRSEHGLAGAVALHEGVEASWASARRVRHPRDVDVRLSGGSALSSIARSAMFTVTSPILSMSVTIFSAVVRCAGRSGRLPEREKVQAEVIDLDLPASTRGSVFDDVLRERGVPLKEGSDREASILLHRPAKRGIFS